MNRSDLEDKLLELEIWIPKNKEKSQEVDLILELIESIRRNSLNDDIQDKYNGYYSYIRNLSCLNKKYDRVLYELVNELYLDWKECI